MTITSNTRSKKTKAEITIKGEDGREYKYSRVLKNGKSTRTLVRVYDGKTVEVPDFKEAQRLANSPEVL